MLAERRSRRIAGTDPGRPPDGDAKKPWYLKRRLWLAAVSLVYVGWRRITGGNRTRDARGWESKAIEAQQEAPPIPAAGPLISPAEAGRRAEYDATLMLARRGRSPTFKRRACRRTAQCWNRPSQKSTGDCGVKRRVGFGLWALAFRPSAQILKPRAYTPHQHHRARAAQRRADRRGVYLHPGGGIVRWRPRAPESVLKSTTTTSAPATYARSMLPSTIAPVSMAPVTGVHDSRPARRGVRLQEIDEQNAARRRRR